MGFAAQRVAVRRAITKCIVVGPRASCGVWNNFRTVMKSRNAVTECTAIFTAVISNDILTPEISIEGKCKVGGRTIGFALAFG